MARDAILEKKESRKFFIPNILTDKKDFDGPLDLLLFLIQENQANVYDLPIGLLTDQFLAYIKEHETELEDLSDFYRMCAELLYIKTKLLLPQQTELDEEYEDPRKELVDRLIEYQKFKKLTELLTGGDKNDRLFFNRPENYFSIPFEDEELFKDVGVNDLLIAFSNFMGKKPPSKIFNIYREVTVAEKEALIMEKLDSEETITIEEIIQDFENPLHTICAFLAILFLAKKNTILFMQKEQNSTIYIFKKPDDWEGLNPDENDRIAEEEILSKEEKDFTLLTKEASLDLDEMIKPKLETIEEEYEYTSDEEEIDLEDDDE